MADPDALVGAALGTLDTYECDGRVLADCPHCGQQGRVTKRRNDLILFECYGQCGGGSGVYKASTQDGVHLTSADSVRAEPVAWTWDGRVPGRAVTLLVERQRLGKTTALVELIAPLTRRELPGAHNGQAVTWLIARSDGPRAHQHHADLQPLRARR
jgi:hypothetical protein